MFSTRSSKSLLSAVAGARSADPVVEIQSYALAGAGLARVLVNVTHNEASRKNPSVIADALRNKMQGKMEAVAGSFTTIEKGNFVETISGLISVVREAMPVTEQSAKLFKAVASNMFMDDEKDMWVLRKTESGDLFVKTTGIDDDMTLVGMLDACASAGFRNSPEYGRMSAQASATANAIEGGQFVSYVNSDNIVACGFIVATACNSDDAVVLPVGAQEGEVIKKAAVTQIHATDEFPSMEQTAEEEVNTIVASARGGVDLNFLLDFYKKVYARSPAFYDQFVQRLQAHQFM